MLASAVAEPSEVGIAQKLGLDLLGVPRTGEELVYGEPAPLEEIRRQELVARVEARALHAHFGIVAQDGVTAAPNIHRPSKRDVIGVAFALEGREPTRAEGADAVRRHGVREL